MKKIILLMLVFLLTGCSSYTELNDLSIVNTLGIDYSNNKYNISLSVIEGNISDKSITYYKASASSLDEAIKNIYLTSHKKLYLSHIDLLILTDNSINYKLKEILDNFLKNNEYRNNFQVVLMNSNDMNTYFENNIASDEINKLINTNNLETGITSKKELETLLKEILIDNNSYLPTIIFNNDKLTLDGYTLIKNSKVYKRLDTEESIYLNILTNNINRSLIDGINIYDSNTSIKINKNKITFNINMTISDDDIDKINNLENNLLLFLEKNKEDNYDILKLEDKIKKNYYSYYKNNNNILDKIEFKINIKTKIQENYIRGGLNEE